MEQFIFSFELCGSKDKLTVISSIAGETPQLPGLGAAASKQAVKFRRGVKTASDEATIIQYASITI